MDELFFRFLELCKKVTQMPHKMEELDFLDSVLSKALYQSMSFYVDETKQLIYTAEVSQYLFSPHHLLSSVCLFANPAFLFFF